MGRYRNLLGNAEVRRLLTGVGIAGASTAIVLALVLAVQAHHSIGAAGLVAAALAIGDGLVIAVRGRLVDRHGHWVMLPLVALHALCLCLFAAGAAEFSVPVLAALAALAGASRAPLFASLRPLWADIAAGPEELDAAYAVHAVFNEVLFIAGPVLVAALATLVSPAAAVAVLAGLQVTGTALFVSSGVSRAWRGGPRTTGLLGALESPGIRTMVAAAVGSGFVFSGLDVACVAFARSEGHAGLGALGLAAMALGSGLAGIAYGAIVWRGALERRYLVLCALTTIGLLPVGLASSVPVLVLLMAVAGLAIAPWTAAELALIDRVAPAGTGTESMTWIIAAIGVGGAIGAALAGQVAQHVSAGWALELSTVGAVLSLVVVLARFRTLRPTAATAA